MTELLKCVVCQGIVSSDASRCPHCGSPNFKSSSFIQEQKQREEIYQNHLEMERYLQQKQREREFGSVLLCRHDDKIRGHSYLWGPGYSLLIDGRPIQDVVEYRGSISDRLTYIRLHPGTHTLTMESRGHVSTKSFSCDTNSHSFTITRKSTGLFAEYWKLVSVTVK